MADLKISQLTGATTPLAGTEVVPLVQSSTTKKVSVANLTAGRTVQMSSLDANGGSSTGGAIISGTIPAIRASSTVLDIGDGNRFLALGANASTPGVIKLIAASSDASIYQYVLTSDTSYNVTFNVGNLIQGTAAKGINFTANTPAAGMTSQLLNDYQEGTFTATDSSGAGLTLTQNIVAQYRKVGSLVFVTFDVTYPTTANTAATSIAMPFSSTVFASGSVGFTTFGSAPGVIFSGSNVTLYNLSTGSTITNAVASGKRFSISGCFAV